MPEGKTTGWSLIFSPYIWSIVKWPGGMKKDSDLIQRSREAIKMLSYASWLLNWLVKNDISEGQKPTKNVQINTGKDMKLAIFTFLRNSLPSSVSMLRVCIFLLFNKFYSLASLSVCVFLDSILRLHGQELRFSSQNCSKGVGGRTVYMWFWWKRNTCNQAHIFFYWRFLLVMRSSHHHEGFLVLF